MRRMFSAMKAVFFGKRASAPPAATATEPAPPAATATEPPPPAATATEAVKNDTALVVLDVMNGKVCNIHIRLHNASDEEVMVAHGRDDRIALTIIAEQDNVDVVELLLAHVPEKQVMAQSRTGCTALMIATERGKVDFVKLLLTHVPEKQVMAENRDGCTALMIAAERGYVDVVKLLLTHVPEKQVMAENRDMGTALMIAAERGYVDIVELLLAHVPEKQLVAECCRSGFSALAYAVIGHRQRNTRNTRKCIDALLAHGSPLPMHAVVLRDLQPIIMGYAQTERVPDQLNQAIAHVLTVNSN